ncbi:MAG: 4Fe-4S dicluster domain-containing protein [Dehalococcoidia bacterium]
MAGVPSERSDGGQKKRVSRRDFLRVGGAATVVGTLGIVAGPKVLGNADAKADSGTGVRYGMVIDLARCHGCRACVQACKVENNTPGGIAWMYVFRFEEGVYPNVGMGFLPRPCMHCNNPPCVHVCPVGARFKRTDGLVLTDFERCIGCRYCEVACPYGVNHLNWKKPEENYYLEWEKSAESLGEKLDRPPYRNPDHDSKYEGRLVSGGGHYVGVMEKCTFCVHRIDKGLLPACVANCPCEVYHFGNLNDSDSEVSRLLGDRRWFQLLEEKDTRPSVYYLGHPPSSAAARLLDWDHLKLDVDETKLEVRG